MESNKGNIYIASTSPPSVLRAYYEQFQRDFLIFLKCRAVELVTGGRMVLTFLGRRSEDPSSKECCYIFELLAIALNDMVSEVTYNSMIKIQAILLFKLLAIWIAKVREFIWDSSIQLFLQVSLIRVLIHLLLKLLTIQTANCCWTSGTPNSNMETHN